MIVRDVELLCEFCVELGRLFGNMLDHGAARAALDRAAQPRQIFLRTNGVNFHSAIAKIAHEAGEMQPLGFILSEIAEADALHNSRDKKASSDLRGSHQIKNCNIFSPQFDFIGRTCFAPAKMPVFLHQNAAASKLTGAGPRRAGRDSCKRGRPPFCVWAHLIER